eukprot:scaffold7366_cov254-Pinguiococcus_pyrenoidosus.AAC.10
MSARVWGGVDEWQQENAWMPFVLAKCEASREREIDTHTNTHDEEKQLCVRAGVKEAYVSCALAVRWSSTADAWRVSRNGDERDLQCVPKPKGIAGQGRQEEGEANH